MSRRGGPDFKGQFGTFLSIALQQVSTVKDAVLQRGKAGKIQLDLTLLKRRRKDALAALGQTVLKLVEAERLDEGEFPELSRALSGVAEVDERIAAEERRARAVAAGLPEDMDMPDWRSGRAAWGAAEGEDEDEGDGVEGDAEGEGESDADADSDSEGDSKADSEADSEDEEAWDEDEGAAQTTPLRAAAQAAEEDEARFRPVEAGDDDGEAEGDEDPASDQEMEEYERQLRKKTVPPPVSRRKR